MIEPHYFRVKLKNDVFTYYHIIGRIMIQVINDGGHASTSTTWSTGRKLGEDVPMEQDEEGQAIIPTGACGAFITALEDEFMGKLIVCYNTNQIRLYRKQIIFIYYMYLSRFIAVRQAAVYSLGKLATNRPLFANMCIDHLADMFNDEIQQVF